MNSLLVMCLVLRGFANDPHPEDKAFYCSKPTTQTELAAHIVPDPSFGRHILFELHPHLAALSTKPKATGSLDVFNDPNAVPEKYDAQEYTVRFLREATISLHDVGKVAAATTAAVLHHLPQAHMDKVLNQLPLEIRTLLQPQR